MSDAHKPREYVFDTDNPEAWSREERDDCRIFRDRLWVQSQSNTESKVLPDGGSEVSPDQIETLAKKAETYPASVVGEVTTLTDALAHPDTSVRENAVDALNDIARYEPDAVTPAVPALVACLDDEVGGTAGDTLRVISKHRPDALEPVIEDMFHKLLDTGIPGNFLRAGRIFQRVYEVRPNACNTLVQQLYDTISDPDITANERREAADKLGLIAVFDIDPLNSVLPELFSHLSSGDPQIRQHLVRVAAKVEADSEYTDALADHESSLRSLLNHDDETAREHAYEALSTIGVAVEPPEGIDEDSSSEE